MKLSISLTDDDVALIDTLCAEGGFSSRSAVIQHALARLRSQGLQADYATAWDEWDADGDAAAWNSTAEDGLAPSKTRP